MSIKNNYNNLKCLIYKLKWIFSQAKIITFALITTIIIGTIMSFAGVFNALVSKSLIDSAISGQTSDVIKYLVVMALLLLLSIVSNPITSIITTHASTKITQTLQKRLYSHIEYSDLLSQSKYHSINLLTRITSDVETISNVIIYTIPSLINFVITIIASFSTLIYLASSIAVAAIIIGPLLIIISRFFSKRLKILYKQIQNEDIKYRAFIQESLQNIMIVKAFCMEKFNLFNLNSIQKNKYNLAMKNSKLSAFTSMSINFCSTLAYFIIFCWGAINISKGSYTYGTFTAMLQLYGQIQSPISSLAKLFPSIVSALAAAERLMEIESLPLEEMNLDSTICLSIPNIKFKNVTFGYSSDKLILNNVNINIRSNETIALVGTSGEGKTTLIKLILSLIKPKSGEIIFYNNDFEESINRNHRNIISYVPQGNTLFSGTIEENLKYGNQYATKEEMIDALRKSCALDFVDKLDQGIYTAIGEKGLGISEGQAQRISIARALLRKKPIFILDEATSSLDPATEIKILNEIKKLSYKPTCIIITHRPSALNICNKIYKLENGILFNIQKENSLYIANELA